MPFWHRLIVVGVVMFVTIVVARLIDRRIARRDLPPEAITRYRIVRRSVTTTIIFVGLLTALLVILQVRAVGMATPVRDGIRVVHTPSTIDLHTPVEEWRVNR